MKNLTNCDPVEFLQQTNKIRHAAQDWLKETKILEIRKDAPQLKEIKDGMTDAEIQAINAENKALLKDQATKNLSRMLDAALETNAEKTVELLAMMCFVDKEDINNHKATEYIKEFGAMIADPDIIDFFGSLIRLGQMGIFDTLKR